MLHIKNICDVVSQEVVGETIGMSIGRVEYVAFSMLAIIGKGRRYKMEGNADAFQGFDCFDFGGIRFMTKYLDDPLQSSRNTPTRLLQSS